MKINKTITLDKHDMKGVMCHVDDYISLLEGCTEEQATIVGGAVKHKFWEDLEVRLHRLAEEAFDLGQECQD